MTTSQNFRLAALLQREFREYRTSVFWTPVVLAVLLATLMAVSVILADRISVIGDTIFEALIFDGSSVNLSISVENGEDEITRVEVVELDEDGMPPPPPPPAYEVIVEGPAQEEQWNFSREWNFNPDMGADDAITVEAEDDAPEEPDLNVLLGLLHGILLLVLFIVTLNYLASSLYDDRKDRSILFWRSMPVGEWEVVTSKFIMALAVAPLIYIAASLLLQIAAVFLMMFIVWRRGESPFELVLPNIDFLGMLLDPVSGWLMTILLVAPAYAWVLLASALAVRSPLWMALLPPVALVIAEKFFLGTGYIGAAVGRHVPHLSDESSVGFYLQGADWTRLDLPSVGSGLVFAAAALWGAVWLRRNRWELNR